MASNAIEQRIEIIAGEWENSKIHKEARLIKINSQADEEDMVDTFFTYMIAVDTPVMDIAFHFETQYDGSDENFTKALLVELQETIIIWNTSQKDERIEFEETIDWVPDYNLAKEEGWPGVFTTNFNILAKALDLPDDTYAVAVFKNTNKNRSYLKWLTNCLEYGIHKKVKYLVTDTVKNPAFDLLCVENRQIHTISLNLDMPNAMAQIAAMGNPNEPSMPYRKAFINMMNAMDAGKEDEAEKWGKVCIEEAENLLSKDPYWVAQLVVIYTALANDKIRYKKPQQTLDYADKAMAVAVAAENYLDKTITKPLIAQAAMFRGTVYFVAKKWEEAYADYETAYEAYHVQSSAVHIVEAARMMANAGFHYDKKKESMQVLADAIQLGRVMDKETALSSSFRIAVDTFIGKSYEKYLSYKELSAICTPLFGEEWIGVVTAWRKVPDQKAIHEMEDLQTN